MITLRNKLQRAATVSGFDVAFIDLMERALLDGRYVTTVKPAFDCLYPLMLFMFLKKKYPKQYYYHVVRDGRFYLKTQFGYYACCKEAGLVFTKENLAKGLKGKYVTSMRLETLDADYINSFSDYQVYRDFKEVLYPSSTKENKR